MKLNRILLALVMIFSCPISLAAQIISSNDHAVFMSSPRGQLCTQGPGYGGYSIKPNFPERLIYGAGIWVAGTDEDGEEHVSVIMQDYYDHNFVAGPVANDYSLQSWSSNFNAVYGPYQIWHHNTFWQDSNYVPSAEIMAWPAHGDTSNGESWMLAPFVDYNNDGVYNPYDGDYPDVPFDQNHYIVYNDDNNPPDPLGGKRLKVEVETMISTTNKSDIPTPGLFLLNVTIRNKSEHTYDDFYVGFNADFDIEFEFDDYVGCDTLLDMIYGFSKNDRDTDPNTYMKSTPSVGFVFLNQELGGFMALDHGNNPWSNPQTTSEAYNLLRSQFRDSVPLTYGGNGYGGNVPVKFAFPGSPDIPNQWNPYDAGDSLVDRIALASFGPFRIEPEDEICLDIGVLYAFGSDDLPSYQVLKNKMHAVKGWYDNQDYKCNSGTAVSLEAIEAPELHIKLYPNPASSTLNYQIKTLTSEVLKLRVFDAYGSFTGIETGAQNVPFEGEMDISSLSAGVYLMVIESDGRRYSRRFVKAK